MIDPFKYRINQTRYKIEQEIAQTENSILCLAFDIKLNRKVILKILKANATRQAISRFKREVEILSQLDHPGVVPVYDSHYENETLYYVMKYISGMSLDKLKMNISFENKIYLFQEVLKILKYIHKQGIIHRDLKPSHILINENNIIHLIDFGISKDFNNDQTKLTGTSNFIGTFEYASPEQFTNGEITIASDIYSLGVIFYELLTGNLPFSGTVQHITHAHVHLTPPDKNFTEEWKHLKSICLKMLEKDPKARYQNCSEIESELEKALQLKPKETEKISKIWIFSFFIFMISIIIFINIDIFLNWINQVKPIKIGNIFQTQEKDLKKSNEYLPAQNPTADSQPEKSSIKINKNEETPISKEEKSNSIENVTEPETEVPNKEESQKKTNLTKKINKFITYTTNHEVNLREEPSTNSSVLAKIAKNTKLQARETEKKEKLLKDNTEHYWYEIKDYDGQTGYIYGKYLE